MAEAGFTVAVTTEPRGLDGRGDPLAMPRLNPKLAAADAAAWLFEPVRPGRF